MISILILTHNRPKLFERTIKSVLDNLPDYLVEILVNNDSKDIKEIEGATYFYEKHEDLSKTYKFLLDKATQEYVYFLEDDDYLLPNFFDNLDFNYDINFINYKHENIQEAITRHYREFEIEEEDFQLGQIVFKKSLINKFPTGNIVTNDWTLFKSLKGSIKLIPEVLWVQTTDGKDNISFPELNVDSRYSRNGLNLGIGNNPFIKQGGQSKHTKWLEIVWNIITLCDYKCYYCTERRITQDNYWNTMLSFDNNKTIVDSLTYLHKYPFKLDIQGGEPLLLPKYHELIDYIYNKLLLPGHSDTFLSITTNGSRPLDWWDDLKYYPKVEYAFSYHVTEVPDDDEFLEKILKVKNKGYTVDLNVMLAHATKYRDRLTYIINKANALDIEVIFGHLFLNRGTTEFGKEYLYKYDKEYWNWINSFNYIESRIDFYTKDFKYQIPLSEVYLKGYNIFKGWKCHTYNYHITQTGKVVYRARCSDPPHSLRVANLLKTPEYFKDIELEPFICPQEHCSYDLYLLDNKKEKI